MKKIPALTARLRARGMLAPAFCALGAAVELASLQKESAPLFWLGLFYAAIGLAMSRDIGQMLAHASE
jgi:hypothetical protein